MSLGRLVPVAIAVGFGILNGYVIFNPAFLEMEADKFKKESIAKAQLGPNMLEIPVVKKSGAASNSSGTTVPETQIEEHATGAWADQYCKSLQHEAEKLRQYERADPSNYQYKTNLQTVLILLRTGRRDHESKETVYSMSSA